MIIAGKIILVLLLVVLNGFFVAAEFSLVAVRKTRIQELINKKNKRAKLVGIALKDLDNVISATQLGITLASLGLGWIGEPALAALFEPLFERLPHNLAVVSTHSLAVIVAFSMITYLHIVFGEVAPKNISLQRAEATALAIITPLMIFTRIFKPFIIFLNSSGDWAVRLLGLTPIPERQLVHSEEEVKMILAQSHKGGVFEQEEIDMIYNVFELSDTPVKEIMTPRSRIIAFDQKTILSDVIRKIRRSRYYSRFPVYKNNLDSIIGFIHIKDIYNAVVQDKTRTIKQAGIIRPILLVKQSKEVDDVMQAMRDEGTHMAVVRDKNKKVLGIVTLENIIESLVGEIEDEFD